MQLFMQVNFSRISILKSVLLMLVISLPFNKCFCQDGKEKIYSSCEISPEFPGGVDALSRYLSRNMVFPKEDCRKQNIIAKYIFTFTVKKDGNISDVNVKPDRVCKETKEALKKMILSMPKWKPGMIGGHLVNCINTIPLKINLSE